MKKKILLGILFLGLLIGSNICSAATIHLSDSNLQGTSPNQYWVISESGSYIIDSSLTTGNQYAIRIYASDVTLDGNGVTLSGSGGVYGVWVFNDVSALNNIIIKNLVINDKNYGIHCTSLNGGRIENVTTNRCINAGIWLHESSNNTLTGNTINDTRNGSEIAVGIFLDYHCTGNTISSNNLNNNYEGLYLITCNDNVVTGNTVKDSTVAGIYLGYETETNSNTITYNVAYNNQYGILVDRKCNLNTIQENTAYNNMYGIMIVRSDSNTVKKNTVYGNSEEGIFLFEYCNFNTIQDNHAYSNKYGIVLSSYNVGNQVLYNYVYSNSDRGIWISDNSNTNDIIGNTADNNKYGIFIYNSKSNTINMNYIYLNSLSGLYLDRTLGGNIIKNNKIFKNPTHGIDVYSAINEQIYNNYIYNTVNIGLAGSNTGNLWYTSSTTGPNIATGPSIGGNCWGTPNGNGYSQTCTDSNNDGFCDSGYVFNPLHPTNIDQLPLTFKPNTKSKLGNYKTTGYWTVDYNGNGQWDGSDIDKIFEFGTSDTTPVVGDWNGDGKEEIGNYYPSGLWAVDYNGNNIWDGPDVDKLFWFGTPGVTPVVGDWNHDGKDEVGNYYPSGLWAVDYNGNNEWNGPDIDRLFWFGTSGVTPVVGDWNNDGYDEVGNFYLNGLWAVDYNGNNEWNGPDIDRLFWFGAQGDSPAVGDWHGVGKVNGVANYKGDGLWAVDWNSNNAWDGIPPDTTFMFGASGDRGIIGKW